MIELDANGFGFDGTHDREQVATGAHRLLSSERTTRLALFDRVKRWLDVVNRPASARFICIALAIVWFGSLVLWRSDYRHFPFICNHDPGAALRTDEVVSAGARPGTDFFYAYGLLSLFVPHLFFATFGHSPEALLVLIGLFSCCSYVGIAWTLTRFRPTRFGMLLLAGAAGHVTWQVTPMYAMEAALLIWAVAFRLRGQSTSAIVIATVALFVKMSMASVILAELVGLAVLDAVRSRRARAVLPVLAAPVTFGICALCMVWWLDARALTASFDPSIGAAMYREYNFGIFREGRLLWDPRGHTVFWYLGGVPGPWCVATAALMFLAIRGGVRLIRAGLAGAERDLPLVSEEAATMSGFANLAYLLGFYGPALNGAWYYAWLLLVGVAPFVARAQIHLGDRALPRAVLANLGWLSLGLLLLSSEYIATKGFIGFVRQPRLKLGAVTITPDVANELAQTLALGHSIGAGVIATVARAPNFGLVDPEIRQARYWQLLKGVPPMRAVDDTLRVARASDAILVPTTDYADLIQISHLRDLLERSPRLHEGKNFLLLRRDSPVEKPTLTSTP